MIYFHLWSLDYLAVWFVLFFFTLGVNPQSWDVALLKSGESFYGFKKEKLQMSTSTPEFVGFKICTLCLLFMGMAESCSTFCLVSLFSEDIVHPTPVYAQLSH